MRVNHGTMFLESMDGMRQGITLKKYLSKVYTIGKALYIIWKQKVDLEIKYVLDGL